MYLTMATICRPYLEGQRSNAQPQWLNLSVKSTSKSKDHQHRMFATFTIARMLYFVGLGLADEKDITVKGLEIVKRAERVYLEAYTAILLVDKEQLVIPPTQTHTSRHPKQAC